MLLDSSADGLQKCSLGVFHHTPEAPYDSRGPGDKDFDVELTCFTAAWW